jgi:hypothetical protein
MNFPSVPGDGGSQVDAKLNKPSTVHVICDKTTKDWFNLWLNLELLAPFIIDCWTDNAKLHYNNETRTTSNSPGVEIRIPGWGTPDVVEWIDPSQAVSDLTRSFQLNNCCLSVETRRVLQRDWKRFGQQRLRQECFAAWCAVRLQEGAE